MTRRLPKHIEVRRTDHYLGLDGAKPIKIGETRENVMTYATDENANDNAPQRAESAISARIAGLERGRVLQAIRSLAEIERENLGRLQFYWLHPEQRRKPYSTDLARQAMRETAQRISDYQAEIEQLSASSAS